MRRSQHHPSVSSFKSVTKFKEHLAVLGVDLPADDIILVGSASPLTRPIQHPTINGRKIGNRWATQPMEGWDGTSTGKPTEDTKRRWRRFGESGAKLVFGGEAMAVSMHARANPRQLV
ncbi:MAG: NADH:flavin oxidoreductase, partial [Verrucomicrobiae bacterium]|nr:NADH:flavin oxidoreductase [Verrucomicrobiae bacterium]